MKSKSWKMYTAGAVVAISAFLGYLGYDEVAKAVLGLGTALGVIGASHKADKILKNGVKFLPLLILLPALLVGCGAVQFNPGTSTPDNPVCERQGFENSYICAQLKANGIQYAETARDIILDANDLSLVLESYTVEQLLSVCDKIESYLDIGGITYETFVNLVLEDTAKAKRVGSILKRHSNIFRSSISILDADRELFRLGLKAIRDSV